MLFVVDDFTACREKEVEEFISSEDVDLPIHGEKLGAPFHMFLHESTFHNHCIFELFGVDMNSDETFLNADGEEEGPYGARMDSVDKPALFFNVDEELATSLASTNQTPNLFAPVEHAYHLNCINPILAHLVKKSLLKTENRKIDVFFVKQTSLKKCIENHRLRTARFLGANFDLFFMADDTPFRYYPSSPSVPGWTFVDSYLSFLSYDVRNFNHVKVYPPLEYYCLFDDKEQRRNILWEQMLPSLKVVLKPGEDWQKVFQHVRDKITANYGEDDYFDRAAALVEETYTLRHGFVGKPLRGTRGEGLLFLEATLDPSKRTTLIDEVNAFDILDKEIEYESLFEADSGPLVYYFEPCIPAMKESEVRSIGTLTSGGWRSLYHTVTEGTDDGERVGSLSANAGPNPGSKKYQDVCGKVVKALRRFGRMNWDVHGMADLMLRIDMFTDSENSHIWVNEVEVIPCAATYINTPEVLLSHVQSIADLMSLFVENKIGKWPN